MSDDFGTPDGLFESGRFMPGESWSHVFEEEGSFKYFCIFHPWMEGIVVVGESIPDYPHDSSGNKIEKFPVIEYTADGIIELDMTWEPNVIKTNKKVVFIYQTYDPATNSNLDKMGYNIIINQNGKEIFRDEGITSVQKIVQPKQTFQLYYEIAAAIIIAPAVLFVFILFLMKRKIPLSKHHRSSTPI